MIRMTLEFAELKWTTRARAKYPTPKRTSCMLTTWPDDEGFARQFGQPVTDWLAITPTKRQRQYVLRDESRRLDHHTTVTLEGREES